MRNRDAEFLKFTRDEGARADQRYARSQFDQAEDIRTSDPAKKDVANDDDMKASHRAILFADRIKIEQSLGRMFMRAIAGIDHTGLEMLRKKLRRTRGTMAQHENICMQRLEITRGVL